MIGDVAGLGESDVKMSRVRQSAFIFWLTAGICIANQSCLWAIVTLPGVLNNHMVVQRDRPVHLWGLADPQEKVTVEFRGAQASTVANALGQWSVYLPSGKAGGPFSMVIQGSNNTRSWNDILVGDVWIAAGQSNMEFQIAKDGWDNSGVQNWQQVVAQASEPKLRLLQVAKKAATYPMPDAITSGWRVCTPQEAKSFSAVAYFFGRELIAKEKIPIGIVEADWGGTPAEAWTSLDALSADPALIPVFAARAQMLDGQADYYRSKALAEQAAAAAQAQGKSPAPIPWHPDPDSFAPGQLFNAMIAPLTPLTIRGVIWYQGESNTDALRAPMYARLFPALIQDWRKQWAQGNFPFLYVQIANFNSLDAWPTVREAQRKALALANTGMVVTVDIGNPANIHPTDKWDVGHRLALWAEDLSYGDQVEDSGPLFRQADVENDHIRVWFDHADQGLVVKGGTLYGFEVAGADKKFIAAQAAVEGDSVVVSSASVPRPMYVRYAWASNPNCPLVNREGLPASPFSSAP